VHEGVAGMRATGEPHEREEQSQKGVLPYVRGDWEWVGDIAYTETSMSTLGGGRIKR